MGSNEMPDSRQISPEQFRFADEVRYIQSRAAERDGRFVKVASLALFSTETGDAWLLDPEDHQAVCLARDGNAQEVSFEESETQFAVRWQGEYKIEGDDFVYLDKESGQTATFPGYPVRYIAELG